MKKIVWAPGAAQDIERLNAFLQPKNPAAARRAVKTIQAGIKLIGRSPNIGRPLPELGVGFREKLIRFGASVYVVRYRIRESGITLLAVRHGRESEDDQFG